jgi:hypothetical protein
LFVLPEALEMEEDAVFVGDNPDEAVWLAEVDELTPAGVEVEVLLRLENVRDADSEGLDIA